MKRIPSLQALLSCSTPCSRESLIEAVTLFSSNSHSCGQGDSKNADLRRVLTPAASRMFLVPWQQRYFKMADAFHSIFHLHR